MSKLVRNSSFRNWAEGKASREEADFWDNWIRESEYNQKLALEAQKKIVGFSFEKKPEARAGDVWEKIDHKISGRETPAPVYTKRSRTTLHRSRRPSAFRQMLKVAAIILVMVTGGVLWYTMMHGDEPSHYSEVIYNHISTEYGEQKEISLSDGSQIILNANSSLRYSTESQAGRRVQIKLDGEAYFLVASRGDGRLDSDGDLFRVETNDGSVQVLGTTFTVSSRNEKTVVVLEEGEVLVLPNSLADEADAGLILQPNELAEFSSLSDDVIKRTVNALVYNSWKDPRLVLQNTPVREMIERLEQTFGVPFEVSDPGILERTISGTVENTDLAAMAGILGEILSTPVTMTDETVYVGTF